MITKNQLSEDIKKNLEFYSGLELCYMLYANHNRFTNLSEKAKREIFSLAYNIGREVGERLKHRGKMGVEALCMDMGVKNIYKMINYNGGERAYFVAEELSIYLNMDSVDEILDIMDYFMLPYFSKCQIVDFYILHELFHYIEEIKKCFVDKHICKLYKIKTPFPLLRDIAAFSFCNTMTENFPCEIIDYLWLIHHKKL